MSSDRNLSVDYSDREVFQGYPSLPPDGIDAVIAWARGALSSDLTRPNRTSNRR